MEFNKKDLDGYVNMLTENLDLVDELPDDTVEALIEYVEEEIEEKDKTLSEFRNDQLEIDV